MLNLRASFVVLIPLFVGCSKRIELPPIVLPPPDTTARLTWDAPATRADGSQLQPAELAGYTVYVGASSETLTPQVEINDPAKTEHTFTDLSASTYYYAVSARNKYGDESDLSLVVSKTIK